MLTIRQIVRRNMGLDRPPVSPARPPARAPQQKSYGSIESAVREAVAPFAGQLAAMIHAAGIEPAYQAPPPPPRTGMVRARMAGNGEDIRRMAHIFSQKSAAVADAVTIERMAKQQAYNDLQLQAQVFKANFDAGYEGTRPGLSASPQQLAEHAEPCRYTWHDGLVHF